MRGKGALFNALFVGKPMKADAAPWSFTLLLLEVERES
jgi:hypothetical protein